MPKRAAELLVDSLVSAGVRHLFTLSGNQILAVYDAAIGRDIQLIHTRHEAAAVHMADGWGRLTEKPGVALVTAGPGHCNSLSALYVALMAESPLVLLSGHCPRTKIGKGAFQEIDQVAMAAPVTKAAWIASDPENLTDDITRALAVAQAGRPGPVHLSLPADVLEAAVSAPPQTTSPGSAEESEELLMGEGADSQLAGRASFVGQALDLLLEAKRPLILAGPAMARPKGWEQVKRLSEKTGIPALPMESPRGVNDPSLHMATNSLARSDVVFLVGKKLDFSLRFGGAPFSKGTRFIQVDSDPQPARVELAISHPPAGVVGDMVRMAENRRWLAGDWRSEVETALATLPDGWHKLRHSDQRPLHPLRVCQALQEALDAGGILVSDGGEFGQWAQAGLQAQHRLINGPSGAIGSSLPMAMAAKLACPQRQVFVVQGDGTFGYHALEFDTAVRYELPFIAIVGNDARWNAEYQLQIQNYGPDRTVGCDLLLSRYDKVAEALGGYGEFVEEGGELAPALKRAQASGLPACLNVAIEGVQAPSTASNAS